MPSFENDVYPQDPEQIAAMQQPGPDGPIYMVNLLKFKEKAEYSDSSPSAGSTSSGTRWRSPATRIAAPWSRCRRPSPGARPGSTARRDLPVS